MRQTDLPFTPRWWGTSLDIVGLDDVRPDMGTYGRYQFENLPPVPFKLRGDFAWLASAPLYDENIGNEQAAKNIQALKQLSSALERQHLHLPKEFITFMESPSLQQRIRSNTDCFLDLCSEPVRSPIGDGYLIRFLADSQGCIFWYLYLTTNNADHAILSSPDWYDVEAVEQQDEVPNPADLSFSAESFEAFLWRFWIENEIWFAAWKRTPLSDVGRAYVEQYRNRQ